LRRLRLVGDDHLARDELWARADPDLPIDILLDESECVTAPAVYIRCPEVEAILDVAMHTLIRVAVEQVGERRREAR
jgi:hypothetical protein